MKHATIALILSSAQGIGRSLSLADAGTRLETAFGQLADSYKETLALIDCG